MRRSRGRRGRRIGATMGAMSDVHQCPFCELRFVNLAELNFHIQLDHPDRDVPEREY